MENRIRMASQQNSPSSKAFLADQEAKIKNSVNKSLTDFARIPQAPAQAAAQAVQSEYVENYQFVLYSKYDRELRIRMSRTLSLAFK